MSRPSWTEIQDRAVDRLDRLDRKTPFDSDADRMALLFERYQALTALSESVRKA